MTDNNRKTQEEGIQKLLAAIECDAEVQARIVDDLDGLLADFNVTREAFDALRFAYHDACQREAAELQRLSSHLRNPWPPDPSSLDNLRQIEDVTMARDAAGSYVEVRAKGDGFKKGDVLGIGETSTPDKDPWLADAAIVRADGKEISGRIRVPQDHKKLSIYVGTRRSYSVQEVPESE